MLGLLFTFAGIGGMLGPWIIGISSDRMGIQAGFGAIVIFCIGMSITFGLLVERRRHINTSYQS
jgi:fucose permease